MLPKGVFGEILSASSYSILRKVCLTVISPLLNLPETVKLAGFLVSELLPFNKEQNSVF
uniref:Uncharacterized protein n=1 Tax=Rhizophagus irregularis (strain DAOM 181602 / DAOM 197198 / MUCL 43194) TaxID=747089 RepID=U9TMA4_RHIID